MNNPQDLSIGGQAVIEGVVMRGPQYLSTAVRRKDATIEVKKEEFISITKKSKLLGLPVLRGFVSLIEILIIGLKTLQFSAERAELDEKEENKKNPSEKKKKFDMILAFLFAFALAFVIFTYLPYQIAYLINLSKESIYFNIFTGIVRIIFFIAYVKLISLMKDIKRIFQYHGAEHKTVHAYENRVQLTPESIEKYTTIHPRCGTSYVFLVLLVSILIFSILDTIYTAYYGVPALFVRILYHLLFVPLIAGLSYEVLKFSGKNINNPFMQILTLPGRLLQKITTQPPDQGQLEVAIVALESALEISTPQNSTISYEEI
ncbi:MAG: DUF1385 domain-containing protein [Candidatus Cloacimonetes bacterium]|nr:DUF1385 domain-containing protein [Candidatus Cloacimonadota bacterium]